MKEHSCEFDCKKALQIACMLGRGNGLKTGFESMGKPGMGDISLKEATDIVDNWYYNEP